MRLAGKTDLEQSLGVLSKERGEELAQAIKEQRKAHREALLLRMKKHVL